MMQITDLEEQQKITPLLRLGFRPFFLAGSIFSVVALVLWLTILKGDVTLSPYGGGYWWHMHEMIFGFGAAIIAGFLLTAIQNWTGITGVQGNKLLILFLVWLAGRVVLIFPQILGVTASIIIDLTFLPLVALTLARPIIAIKQYRNLFFVPLLALFTLVNIEMYMSLEYPSDISMKLAGYAGVMLTTLLMSIMAGRVVPMFTANGTQTSKVLPISWLEKLTNGTLALCAFMLILHPFTGFYSTTFGITLLLAGVFQLIRWLRWKPWITLPVPLLWSLHISILFVWLALVLLGLSYILPKLPSNHIWHLLTIGGMGGIILAMIARVSLGHTGRKLLPAKLMSLAFSSIFISALIRAFLPWISPELTFMGYNYSVIAWVIAFGLFIIIYAPILCSPRADDRPG